jgi:hypothetical protein
LTPPDLELTISDDFEDIDSISLDATIATTPRQPRHHRDLDGTQYIELISKKDKGKIHSAWCWGHGTEFEIQNRGKREETTRLGLQPLQVIPFLHNQWLYAHQATSPKGTPY